MTAHGHSTSKTHLAACADSRPRRRRLLFAVAAALALMATVSTGPAQARALCGTKNPTAAPRHVLIVMLENRSYHQVIGNSAAPFENSLAKACGDATSMWGATHSSAANYLAVSFGQYPSGSVHGCNYAACASSATSVYQQLDSAGRGWKAYEEAMPSACDKSNGPLYKIGHNPPIFSTGISSSECAARDVPVTSLTARSGAFWNDLHSGHLRAVSWITPDTSNDGEASCGGSCGLSLADSWLQKFISLVAESSEYRSGSTAIFVTYDEGTGADAKIGEDCTDKAADLAGSQPSCHVPLFVIYPGTKPGARSGTFFDHYSLTRAVEGFFGLGYLAHAADPQTVSLANHFGLVK
jgi:phosphatidylinositol-3-phosphatase